jgi:hypothetical protein
LAEYSPTAFKSLRLGRVEKRAGFEAVGMLVLQGKVSF